MQLDKFEGADFKYDNSFFKKNLAQKYQNKAFLLPNLNIFILHQTLQAENFEDVDLKYDNSFFEFYPHPLPENTQIKHFFCPKGKYFLLLHETSYIKKFEGTD